MRILVTGGAGYIGSHVLRKLAASGHEVVAFDNLSTGHADAVVVGDLVVGDLNDLDSLRTVMAKHFDAVMHFAANTIVEESISNPLKYYRNNTSNTLNLLSACEEFGVKNIVFSSTAAVYGIPLSSPISENERIAPINPYGASKAMSERIIMDLAKSNESRYVILRYFNVAGASPDLVIGQRNDKATHLIKVACELATGKREGMTIFGNDYPTRDGTCIRDYIHVDDLASAHALAIEYLNQENKSVVLNCGYGRGHSVAEVVGAVSRLAGHSLNITMGKRRAGDPPEVVASTSKIVSVLGWEPRFDEMDQIVSHALAWEEKLGAKVGA